MPQEQEWWHWWWWWWWVQTQNLCNKHKGQQGGTKTKFKGECNNCGTFGHMARDCCQKPENAHKRPAGYKGGGGENANAAISGGHNDEIIMCQLAVPKISGLLEDPNIWICDTDATPHANGMINKKKASSEDDAVTMGNGKAEQASMIGDIPGVWCDQQGQVVEYARLTDVTYIPNSVFNLFSATKRLKQGWTMHGNADMITFTKGDKELVFDITIETKKGAIFCAYIKRTNVEIGAAATTGIS
jgi:hypothetical protein